MGEYSRRQLQERAVVPEACPVQNEGPKLQEKAAIPEACPGLCSCNPNYRVTLLVSSGSWFSPAAAFPPSTKATSTVSDGTERPEFSIAVDAILEFSGRHTAESMLSFPTDFVL